MPTDRTLASPVFRKTAGSSSRPPLKKWYKKISPTARRAPPSRDPPRGRQIADRGGSPSFLRHPRSPNRHAHSTRHAQVYGSRWGTRAASLRPTPAPSRLYERLLAEAVSADTARPAARAGAAQPHTHQHEPPMHDILRGPAASHRAGLPAFCWPPVKQAESRTGATRTPRQAHRAPQPVRTARTAPLSPDLGQPADDETGRWAVLPALWPMRAWLGVVGGVSTSAYRGPIEVERRAYPLRRQIAPHRQHHPPARRPGRIEDRPDQRSLARTAAPYARSSVPPSNNGSGRPAPRASFASRAISSLTRCIWRRSSAPYNWRTVAAIDTPPHVPRQTGQEPHSDTRTPGDPTYPRTEPRPALA